jgi:hypothetical protein
MRFTIDGLIILLTVCSLTACCLAQQNNVQPLASLVVKIEGMPWCKHSAKNNMIFAKEYKLYLPSKADLKKIITKKITNHEFYQLQFYRRGTFYPLCQNRHAIGPSFSYLSK